MSLLLFWCFWQMEPWLARFLRLRGTSAVPSSHLPLSRPPFRHPLFGRPPLPLSSVRPSIPQASTAQPRQVALTFDDGPHQTCTPALLDGLKQRGVKAQPIFLMGENIAGKESLVQRMQEEGHLIGNPATATSR